MMTNKIILSAMVKMQSFSFQIEIQIDHDNMLGCDMFTYVLNPLILLKLM
jgi:hypothetical protein